jgi:alpha-beta hydrolase superfamily lysophospholipase
MERLRAENPGLPLVLYGHSMGGLIVAGYVLRETPRPLPDLVVLSSPGLDVNVAPWKRSIAPALSRILPKMRITNGLTDGGLSRDPEVARKADADPLCSDASTTRFGAEAFAEQDRVNGILRTLPAMPVPTYVFHGSADPIVPLRATAVFEGMVNTTRHVHDGLRHECHHEPEREHVLGEVVSWIGAQGVPVRGDHATHHDDDHDHHHDPHAVEADVHADPAAAV